MPRCPLALWSLFARFIKSFNLNVSSNVIFFRLKCTQSHHEWKIMQTTTASQICATHFVWWNNGIHTSTKWNCKISRCVCTIISFLQHKIIGYIAKGMLYNWPETNCVFEMFLARYLISFAISIGFSNLNLTLLYTSLTTYRLQIY